MNRRDFIKSSAVAVMGGSALAACTSARRVRYISAHSAYDGQFYISGIDAQGRKQFSLPVNSRGHGMAVNPVYTNRVVYVSRRPGTELHHVDLISGSLIAKVSSHPGRHFVGHAYFSFDGRYLFTPENDYEKGKGVIAIRDAQSLQVLSELPSYGIGPHEVHLLSDGKTLVVANGGMLTHPSQPRKKLNLDSMKSSLAYIDTQNGKLLGSYLSPDQQQSIRHLDVESDDSVAMGVQYQGAPTKDVALIYQHRGEQSLQAMQSYDWLALKQYTGSVTFAEDKGLLVVSSPRAHKLTLWDSRQQRLLKEYTVYDVCGVAWDHSRFVVTTGTGFVHQLNIASLELSLLRQEAGIKWDNHLVAI